VPVRLPERSARQAGTHSIGSVLLYADQDEFSAGCNTEHKRPIASLLVAVARIALAEPLRWSTTGIVERSIDTRTRAQIFRKLFLLAPTPDGDSLKSHVRRGDFHRFVCASGTAGSPWRLR
jgi:hypothetical protein